MGLKNNTKRLELRWFLVDFYKNDVIMGNSKRDI